MAKSTFHYHLSRLQKEDKYESVRKCIAQIYNTHKGRYGYRRITIALQNQGYTINHKTVERLMSEMNLKSLVRVKKYRSYRGDVGRIAPNVLQRDFAAIRPNQKWVTDVTEFMICGSKRYLSPVMDLFNSEIIDYTISDHPNLVMVTSMLEKVIKRADNGLILHSDQGWHYQHLTYRQMLAKRGIIQSMSRKGNCLDNAVIENFFGLLKSELLYLQKFNSVEQFDKELKRYIYYYNNQRIKSKLKMSPIQYRTHFTNIN